jgi:5-methylcytosine-specific restriction endonuclease McrBC GTP-binding regulatory subunit McrB
MLFDDKHKTLRNFDHQQVIFYGAPGTGKSHGIKEATEEAEKQGNVFRTTFHPDSDYSTFIGAYKPTMAKRAVRNVAGDIVKNNGQEVFEETIVYKFTPQAFTNAYIRAWQTNEPVYLVIEEINRGNCAQIFGDLFQLLDRDDEGKSKYPIIPDTDLGNYIESQLLSYDNVPEEIRQGKSMLLPSNLFIWASMNTSDQSLFPIDSAFKRRWDWKYVPIENANKNYKIKVNNTEYDWWEFLKAINKEVFELTNSEDKQLGYFFVKKTDGIIDAETLVNKVYFYLWNDVFKDYDLDSQKAFRNQETQRAISFKEFFEGGLNEELAEQVLLNLELEGRPLDE